MPFCAQTESIKKQGQGKTGHQRYRCQLCRRTFLLDYAYLACQPGMKEQIVYLVMYNAGIRDTARTLHISINAVARTLKTLAAMCTPPLENLQVQLICEVEAMWSFVSNKKQQRWRWYAGSLVSNALLPMLSGTGVKRRCVNCWGYCRASMLPYGIQIA